MNRFTVTIINGRSPQLPLSEGANAVLITGSPTLSQSWALVADSTPAIGHIVNVQYRATPTLGTGTHVTVFESQIPDTLVALKLDITATYTNSGWQTTMIPSFDQTGFIEATKLKAIGRAKLLIGAADGTVKAIDISHLLTVEDDDTITLHAGIISASKLTSDFSLTLDKIVGPTKGKFIKSNVSTGVLEEVDMVVELPASLTDLTAGTATAGKAVVLDVNGQISGLDLVSVKLGGVALDVSITTLNKLVDVTTTQMTLLKYLETAGLTTADVDRVIAARP